MDRGATTGHFREPDFPAASKVTAARTSAFNAFSSTGSPSRISMARRVLPSRLALKSPDGSASVWPRQSSCSRILASIRAHRNPAEIC